MAVDVPVLNWPLAHVGQDVSSFVFSSAVPALKCVPGPHVVFLDTHCVAVDVPVLRSLWPHAGQEVSSFVFEEWVGSSLASLRVVYIRLLRSVGRSAYNAVHGGVCAIRCGGFSSAVADGVAVVADGSENVGVSTCSLYTDAVEKTCGACDCDHQHDRDDYTSTDRRRRIRRRC